MELVEIRDLDGPNIFLLEPAIKLELVVSSDDLRGLGSLSRRLGGDGAPADASAPASVGEIIRTAVVDLHRRSGVAVPRMAVQELETPGHIAVAYGWDHRRFAMRLAEGIGAAIAGKRLDAPGLAAELRDALAITAEDDRPLLVRDEDRHVRAIAVTGTNGKTTTTRLIAHIMRGCGLHVGWCSSSGVYLDGREVVRGDYSGPSGARRVLLEPGLDVGVLETARGGILLRGVAYESNDVGVLINVSADHLDLQGVRTVEGLARVKSVVVRVTRADGVAVLNADDPLVVGATADIRARKMFVSQRPESTVVARHLAAGGDALTFEDGRFQVWRNGERRVLVDVDHVPIAYGGKAPHMIENALCAAAACLAYGLNDDQVRAGLATFSNSPEQNIGRLNVVRVGGITVVVDYAHNEAGLTHLIEFARLHLGDDGRLITVIGTAGDRTDRSLREIGRIAAEGSDAVVVKGTERYLRGRSFQDLIDRYLEGIRQAGREPAAVEPLEMPALIRAIELANDGDVVAIMAQEQIPDILRYLTERAGEMSHDTAPGDFGNGNG